MPRLLFLTACSLDFYAGGAVAPSLERPTPVEQVTGSIPTVTARSLQVGSVSV